MLTNKKALKQVEAILDLPKSIRKAVRKETDSEAFRVFGKPKPSWATESDSIAIVDLQLLWVSDSFDAQPAGSLKDFWQGDPNARVRLQVDSHESTPTLRVENGNLMLYNIPDVPSQLSQADIDWEKVEGYLKVAHQAFGEPSRLQRTRAEHSNKPLGLIVCTRAYVQDQGSSLYFAAKNKRSEFGGAGQPTWVLYGGFSLTRENCLKSVE